MSTPELPVTRKGWQKNMDVKQHFESWHVFRTTFLISGCAIVAVLGLLAFFLT